MTDHAHFMKIAFAQARKGAEEGGVPVGACLVHDGRVVAEGRNRRQQERTIVLHGETDCLRQAGLFGRWSECTMYTTLSPCMMCTGTIIQFRIPRLVIGDAVNFGGNETLLRERGVEVTVLDVPEMIDYFAAWMKTHLDVWNGDIGL
jgi:creatinine deaminase